MKAANSVALDMETLRDAITKEKPFGPSASEEVGDAIFQALFTTENSICEELKTRPSLIVGRRGSGKTAILCSLRINREYPIVIEVSQDKHYVQILKSIEKIDVPTVESVSDTWERVIWTSVLSDISKSYRLKEPSSCAIIDAYLDSIGAAQGISLYKVVRSIIKLVKKQSSDASDALDVLDDLAGNIDKYELAKIEASNLLRRKKQHAIVLIDNMEQVNFFNEKHCSVMSGLLMAVFRFRAPENRCEVRCSIPAEAYHKLIEISSNTEKDFSSSIVLHWKTSELVQMIAIRYKLFLSLHATERVFNHYKNYDLTDKNQINQFISHFFPKLITNKLGEKEYTLRYILRHTQLLPRQLIGLCNSIGKIAVNKSDNFIISEDDIVKGVNDYEHIICQGIFSGYKNIYPDAKNVCDIIIPNITHVFNIGEFQKKCRQSKSQLGDEFDFRYHLKTLIEIGCIGIVDDLNGEYIQAKFSYNLPNELKHQYDDLFCIHPVFMSEYRVKRNTAFNKPVMPQGANIDIQQT